MKYLPVLALFAVAALCHAVPFFDVAVQEWEAFKLEYGKKYSSEVEDKFRMKIFMENKYKIAKHNAAFEKGYYNFTLGLNKYADMLPREFVEIMNGFNRTKKNLRQSEIVGATFISPANVELPTEVDWRDKGAVTPVKDQGHCGSCWAFSTTGSLEGQHFRSTGKLVSLSEQNLIDCSAKYHNYGCDGGDMDQAFLYIRDNGGIDTEKSYPYEAVLDDCIYSPETNGATDLGYVKLKSGSEQKLKEAVATIGPISIAIDASLESFQLYKEGVYSDVDCGSTIYDLDHAVLVVGYGTEKKSGLDYWIVKNSWSATWGDDGYIKMSRNNGNNCGIATYASYPLV